MTSSPNRKKTMDELGRPSVETFREATRIPVMLVLDQIRSMQNVGAIFRSSDAFSVEGICLCGYTPKPPHRDIEKTALGATATVPWLAFDDTIQACHYLREKGYRLLGIEQVHGSIPLQTYPWKAGEKYAVIFGNEVLGVGDEVIPMCDAVIEIPQSGTKHSLNVSVCAGIVLWEISRHISQS